MKGRSDRKRLRSALLAAAALGLLTSCGGSADISNPVIEPEERRLGAEQHPKLLAEFGGAYAGPEAAYVAQIGEKLAGAAGLSGQCRFTLVNTDVVNAFAVPGCFIYVTRGLMAIVNSEDELASVLAHELGHIVADHSERQQRRSVFRSIGVAAVSLITGSERLSRIAGQAAELFTLRYSRAQEYESDDIGIRYLRETGYDPHAAGDMLGALARQERYLQLTSGQDAKGIPEWVRTHPLTENRIERARQAARDVPDGPEQVQRFLDQVDGLLFADDPEQGFVLGRRFAHPVMRIAFEAPPGFTLTNSTQAVLINGPDGIRGEFAGVSVPPGTSLDAYVSMLIRQMFGNHPIDIGTGERGVVNGARTLVVPITVRGQNGAAQVTIAAYNRAQGPFYHFITVTDGSAASAAPVAQLFSSFEFLSEAEIATLRPRIIEVVRAGPGDSWETLSARMASDSPLEHLLMLNGRERSDPLQPGERVKIVRWAAS